MNHEEHSLVLSVEPRECVERALTIDDARANTRAAWNCAQIEHRSRIE
jgi:hypothetical protein